MVSVMIEYRHIHRYSASVRELPAAARARRAQSSPGRRPARERDAGDPITAQDRRGSRPQRAARAARPPTRAREDAAPSTSAPKCL